jgi:hypothetical protein
MQPEETTPVDLPAATSQDQSGDNPAGPGDPAADAWPSVSDYWPDNPQRSATPPDRGAAQQPDDDGITWIGADGGPGPSRGRRSLLMLGWTLGAVLLLVVGAVMATLIKQAHEDQVTTSAVPSPVPPDDGADAGTVPTAATDPSLATGAASLAPAPTPTPALTATTRPPSLPAAATFELAGVAPAVTLHTRALGADLYRVTVAKGGAAEPRVSSTGAVYRLALTHNGKTAQAPVDITLNASVRWSVRLTGGTSLDVLDFGDSSLAAVELAAGASRIDLTLPPASGTLPVLVTKGINQLRVRTSDNDPVRLNLRVGAGKVVLDGRTRNGVSPGVVLATSGWAVARNRIDLDAKAGVGVLSLAG